jgi:KaiC/GvpD/RAD55 family RecA-like ATPase
MPTARTVVAAKDERREEGELMSRNPGYDELRDIRNERRNGHRPEVIGIRASEVITKSVEWLWDKRIPKGKLTMFDGDPDVGKSIITMDLAARVSTGRTFPDGAACEAGNVLIVNVEDAKDDTVVPRLKAHGADLERIIVIDGMPDEKGGTRLLDLPDDVGALKAAVEHYEAVLLIIDPVITMLGGDMNKDGDARKALAPLRDMAEATGVTIVAVRHLNKNISLSAIQRGGGNMGLIGVARSGAFFAHHPEQDGLRVMAPHKSNLAEKQPSLQYVVKSWAIDENIGRIEWMGITSHDANSLASGPASPAEKSKQDEAKEFLRDELGDGPMWAKTVYRDADAAGISKGTLLIAKNAMRVYSEKIGTEGWQWSLLPEGTKHSGDYNLSNLSNLSNLQSKGDSEYPYIKEGTKDVKGTKGTKDAHARGGGLAPSLSADEDNERVQRLLDEGWALDAAIAEVLGEEL